MTLIASSSELTHTQTQDPKPPKTEHQPHKPNPQVPKIPYPKTQTQRNTQKSLETKPKIGTNQCVSAEKAVLQP